MRVAPDATTWADVELWSWWLPPAELKLWKEDGGWVDSCGVQITTGCDLDHDQMFSGYNAGEVLATLPALEPRAVAVHLWGCEARHGTQPTFPATGRCRSPTGFSTTFGGGTLYTLVVMVLLRAPQTRTEKESTKLRNEPTKL